MVALGAHYLPFVFLYGMRVFAVLSAGLVGLGMALARDSSVSFTSPAWITGGILIGFAVLGLAVVAREQAKPVSAQPGA